MRFRGSRSRFRIVAAPLYTNRKKHAARLFYVLETISDFLVSVFRARGVHGSSKTTSTFLPRRSHTLTRAPNTFSTFRAHGATFSLQRTHGRWSLILHNCIFYCPYKLASHIGHFICKLPKNNVANVRAILEGAEPPIASPSASVMAALFLVCRRHGHDRYFFRHIRTLPPPFAHILYRYLVFFLRFFLHR